MVIESRETRNVWLFAVLGLVPDVALGLLVAGISDSGVLGVLFTVVGLQILYALIWIKNSVWRWIVFRFVGRKQIAAHFLSYLVDNKFPEPAEYERSVQGYLNSVADNEASPIDVRLKAAAMIGMIGARPLIGGMQHAMQLSMAQEDALLQFRELRGRNS